MMQRDDNQRVEIRPRNGFVNTVDAQFLESYI